MKADTKWSMDRLLHRLLSELDSALLTRCSLCLQDFIQSTAEWNKLLCSDCFEQYITEQGLGSDPLCTTQNRRYCCKQCGLAMKSVGDFEDLICGACLKHPPVFDECHTLFDYQYPLQSWITQIKHQQQMLIARKLSQLLAVQLQSSHIKNSLPCLLIPVPQSKARAKQLGFNPAHVIAKQIGQVLNIAVQSDWVIANPKHLPQKHLNAYERMKNMANAFELNAKHSKVIRKEIKNHQKVAIIDDVVTTNA